MGKCIIDKKVCQLIWYKDEVEVDIREGYDLDWNNIC
jgi:hypothetical protein